MKVGGITKHIAVSVALALVILTSAEARAIPVADINITGTFTVSEKMIRDVICLKPGDEFSWEELDRSINYLRKWGVFDVIHASPVLTPEGVVINIHLEQATIVVSIDIAGNYPYIDSKIKKNLSMHAGDIYTPDKLEEQIDRIKDFYKREGFVNTEVYVDEVDRPEAGGIALTFHIRRGEVLRYRRIEIKGNRAFPDGRFVSAINPLRTYSERRLRKALRKLTKFYHLHGYPKARIKLASKKIDFEARRVDIVVEVFEGPYVKIVFVGSPDTSRKLLRDTVTILKEGNIDQFEIETSAQALRDLFREQGYPNAKVEYKKSLQTDGSILITFYINKGRPQWISRIYFRGLKHVKKSKLMKEMRNQQPSVGKAGVYYPESMEQDNEIILKKLRSKGYLDAQVAEWIVELTDKGLSLEIIIPIEEGRQVKIQEVYFEGNEAFSRRKLLRKLANRPGRALNEPELEEEKQRLLTYYANHGYPYAEVSQSWGIDEVSGKAWIRYQIKEGKLVRIGRILIVGDVLTSQKAIRNAMSLKEGDPFSYKKLIDSRLSIRRLGPFSAVSVETIGLEDKQEIVHLRVRVEEQRPFFVDLGFNYSTDEQFTGSLTFSNVNAFGWAKTNSLRIIGGKDLSRAEVGWLDPRFLGSSFEMATTVWVQYKHKPAYTFNQLGGAMSWFRRFRRLGFFFRYELDRNYFIEGDSTAADADSLRDNTISEITLSASYDSRDSFSDPRQGFFTLGKVDIFNEISGNHANFVKFGWQGENDFSLGRRITLSTALRFDRILTMGHGVSVPTNELLFMGGDDTVRGFSEDSLGPVDAQGKATGSRARWILNEELRLRLISRLAFVLFYDMGSLTNEVSDMRLGTIRNSAGLGLRYITPVGPLRAEYGFKLDRRPGESRGRFHFTFGYVF